MNANAKQNMRAIMTVARRDELTAVSAAYYNAAIEPFDRQDVSTVAWIYENRPLIDAIHEAENAFVDFARARGWDKCLLFVDKNHTPIHRIKDMGSTVILEGLLEADAARSNSDNPCDILACAAHAAAIQELNRPGLCAKAHSNGPMNDTRKAVIITAGPTNERIDAVMQITNMSTGKLGAMIAETMLNADGKHAGTAEQIRKIYYFSNKLSRKPIVPDGQADKLQLIETTDADDMLSKLTHVLTSDEIDLMVHTAAVGDYKARYSARAEDIAEEIAKQIASAPYSAIAGDGTAHIATIRAVAMGVLKNPAGKANDDTKMSSQEPNLMTVMDLTPKIIGRIKDISPATMLIGCKLLEGVDKPHLFRVASELRQNTRADYIIANDLAKIGNGRHPAMIIGYDHAMDRDAIFTECKSKQEIANAVCLLAFQNADAKFKPHTMTNTVWQVIAANNMNTDIRVEGFSSSRSTAWEIMADAFLETLHEMLPDVSVNKDDLAVTGFFEFDDECRRASIQNDSASVFDGEDMWYYNLVPVQEKATPDDCELENNGII